MPKLKVSDLLFGDMVDLEGDAYADPKHDHPEYEFEYAVVDEITVESPTVTLVEFWASACGFPPDHELDWGGSTTSSERHARCCLLAVDEGGFRTGKE